MTDMEIGEARRPELTCQSRLLSQAVADSGNACPPHWRSVVQQHSQQQPCHGPQGAWIQVVGMLEQQQGAQLCRTRSILHRKLC